MYYTFAALRRLMGDGVAVDYDRSILSGLGGGLLNVNRTDEERMQAAIKRQYTVGGEKIYVKRT